MKLDKEDKFYASVISIGVLLFLLAVVFMFTCCTPKYGCPQTKGMSGYDIK